MPRNGYLGKAPFPIAKTNIPVVPTQESRFYEALWQRELAALAEDKQHKKWTWPTHLVATTGIAEPQR